MSRNFAASLLMILFCCAASAQTVSNNPPATNPTGNDSTSQQSQPALPPNPPDVLMPDRGTLPMPSEKKKSAFRRKLEQLKPNCIDIIFHTCWSSPPAPEPKPGAKEAKDVDPEYVKDMEVGDFYL